MLQTKNKSLIAKILALSVFLCMVFTITGDAALGDRQLAKGSRGDEVKQLQQKLNQLGYSVGSIDGVFGNKTETAVKKFQKDRGLKVDGIVGSKTGQALQTQSGENKTSSGKAIGYKNSDTELLARCISAEARGEPYMGQVAVAAVILNRIESSAFPNSIPAIVYQPGAFSSVDDGQINQSPSESAVKASREAMNGSDPTHGCIYFFNPAKSTSKWIWSREQVLTIGKHIFAR